VRSLFGGLLAAQSHFISTGSSVESLQQVLAACARRLPLSGAAVFALDGSAPLTLANLGEARGLEAHALGSEAPDIVVLRCLEVEVVVASLVLSGPGLADAASQLAPALPVIARLAQARHRGEQHRRDIVNAVGAVVDGGFDWDIITGVVTYSPSFLEMLGLEGPGPHITEWNKLVHPDDLRRQEAAIEAHYFGRAELYQAEYRCKNARTGEWVWLEVRGRIVERRPDGTPVKLVGSHTDITSRKALDARFARTDRLASLGTMAAGMAHEINNPLAFMQSNLEFVRRGLSEPLNEATLKELDIALEDTLEGTARIGRIVRDLRVQARAAQRGGRRGAAPGGRAALEGRSSGGRGARGAGGAR
jgi:PAS domain S-box-containing protein